MRDLRQVGVIAGAVVGAFSNRRRMLQISRRVCKLAYGYRAGFRIASDRVLREIDQAIVELPKAKEKSVGTFQQQQTDLLIERAFALRP